MVWVYAVSVWFECMVWVFESWMVGDIGMGVWILWKGGVRIGVVGVDHFNFVNVYSRIDFGPFAGKRFPLFQEVGEGVPKSEVVYVWFPVCSDPLKWCSSYQDYLVEINRMVWK